MSTMEELTAMFQRQSVLTKEIERVQVNFRKDSASRKTQEYIQDRINKLDNLWSEFQENHNSLKGYEDKQYEYFSQDVYGYMKNYYSKTKTMIATWKPLPSFSTPVFEDYSDPSDEHINQQETNFRAFHRLINRINIDSLEEKWEIEDELKSLQNLWTIIDTLHLRIDNKLKGSNEDYESEFIKIENLYINIKKQLNRKLSSSTHLQHATPKLELPIFTGKYTQWPTFFDLFLETIHNNKCLSQAQKMQHLKGKVKGEAERLIQHLHISAENYNTAWDILTHRYNNPQILFSTQIEILINQPTIHKQSSFAIKKLHDTTAECINSIQNLGIDVSTWDPLLVHLLSKKLDDETLTDYMESRQSPRDLASYSEFMNFIENKFMALESISKKQTYPTSSSSKHNATYNRDKSSLHPFYKKYQAVATYTKKNCPVCKAPHELFQCKRFQNQLPETQIKTIEYHDICPNCLYKHYGKKCLSTKRCKQCNGEHNTLIHNAIQHMSLPSATRESRGQTPQQSESTSKPSSPYNVNYVASNNEEVLLTTVLLNIKASDGSYIQLRALLDQGSQIALISENAAQLLGLKRQYCKAAVSGIGSAQKYSKALVSLQCESIYGDYHFTTEALVVSRVINNLPNTSFTKQVWPHLQHTRLADPEYNISKPIDLLLDASVYSDIIMSGLIKGPLQAPIAQQTKIGWILSGNVKTFACHVVINSTDDISKYWEVEDITDACSTLSSEDHYCEEHYQATTSRLDSGKYEVSLPMRPNYQLELGTSRSKAMAQYIQQEKRIIKNSSLAENYRKFMYEYRELGHMREVTNQGQNEKACYLPHHGVLKEDSTTTALRVVFNGASKTSSGYSLNDLMYSGPNLQQDLYLLILRWRQYKYVVTADIEKMFRQIFIRQQDQHLQTILWRDTRCELIREYQLTTITYGTKAAPFLAMRTLKQIGIDNAEKYPLAASALQSSFYMDDLLGGSNDINQGRQLQVELVEVLRNAGMNLRKWSSNEPALIENLTTEQLNTPFEFKDSESRKTLGLRWTPSNDTFTFSTQIDYQSYGKPITKRMLLSDISKIYDPIGWLSPLTVRVKILFQRTWTAKLSWDEELPADISREWEKLRDDLQNINIYSIPRYIGHCDNNIQLHGFCDASEKAYACAIYVVTTNDKGLYTSRLLTAKTKVAPINKTITLPRLELLGAFLLSRLIEKVLQVFSTKHINIYAWTDSMIVLHWLQGDLSKKDQFVANRVQKIVQVIPASHWDHVKSSENAADCCTRGLSSENLSHHLLWWEGPEWLLNIDQRHITTEKLTPISEKAEPSVQSALCQSMPSFITQLINKFSSFKHLVRTVAWVLRYIACLRHKNASVAKGALTSEEIRKATNTIIKEIQFTDFNDDIAHLKKKGYVKSSSRLSCLHPFLDKHGLLRVGGRLEKANLTFTAKHPIILAPGNRMTELIIHQAHIATLHGGPKLTLSYTRNTYWIISGINCVKKQLRSCIKCRRFSQDTNQQIMADLPQPRVTPSRPFSNVGVDFTGHVDIKANKGRGIKTTKGYIAVFVCMATKATHLELVSDLSTAAFLAAFRRMCSRRGTPKNVYSDNGTNFVGAARLLKQEYQEIMDSIKPYAINDLNNMGITWHFNAPVWPNAGGLWEAAVKSLKHHLKRVLGEQKLTYEEFTTLLYQIEACLNSRPLCALTENPDDTCLTPGHFLIGESLISRPQTDPNHINLSTRWQLVQSMNKQFWKKWSTEYLQQLQARTKWRRVKRDIDIGDLVIIKEDNMPPGKWAMARVEALHPGHDRHVRVVTLKTANNFIKRPVNKLIVLPVHEPHNKTMLIDKQSKNADSTSKTESQKKQLRNKARFNMSTLITSVLVLLAMFITPSTQQSSVTHNITSLTSKQNLFFDKISEMQHIRDEWKLIVYYNMSSYWQGLEDLKRYIKHLDTSCKNMSSRINQFTLYSSIISQLQHELNEIEHYNSLLRNPTKRMKRGLVNGVGNLASYLFGVLDDKFAQQYKNDIEKITLNENHLQNLLRNQTLVVESEYNIIRRNEDIMNKQFVHIEHQMKEALYNVNKVQSATLDGLYMTSSALSASIALTNLRRMQQNIIDVITDIYHGQIDARLFPPEQLESQVNIIIRQIQDGLTIPMDQSSIKGLYKLLKVFARICDNYLIMEIKIPVISTEVYELDQIITLSMRARERDYQITSAYPYIAFNMKKDLVIFISESDLQLCLHQSPTKILCPLNNPVYDIKAGQSICDIKINTIKTSPCSYTLSKCSGNKWIKLHHVSDWLYSCCEKCAMRLFTSTTTELITLSGNGIINLCQGCTLKGDTFKIYSHKDFINHVNEKMKGPAIPQMSIVNDIMETSVPNITLLGQEDHQSIWRQLKSQIDDLKQQSAATQTLSVHDVHQYGVLYLLVGGAILTGFIILLIRIKRRRRQQAIMVSELGSTATARVPVPQPRRMEKSTSTPNIHLVKFNVPLNETD